MNEHSYKKYVNISVGWKGNKDSIYIKWCRAADFYCVFFKRRARPIIKTETLHISLIVVSYPQ